MAKSHFSRILAMPALVLVALILAVAPSITVYGEGEGGGGQAGGAHFGW